MNTPLYIIILKKIVALSIIFSLINIVTISETSYSASSLSKNIRLSRPVFYKVDTDDNSIILRWRKVKGAKKYQVFMQTGKNKWKYVKTIRNRKPVIKNTINYKLKKVEGHKNTYRLYKRTNDFRLVKSLKKNRFVRHVQYGSEYGFIVRAVRGKYKSRFSKRIKAVIQLIVPDQENIRAVEEYAKKLFEENMAPDRNYLDIVFTWDQEFIQKKSKNPNVSTAARSWLYYNGLMMEALLSIDPEHYSKEILRFYCDHIDTNGHLLIKEGHEISGVTLDHYMPIAVMLKLINDGFTDDETTQKFNSAINHMYNKLENQYMYDGENGRAYAGKLWLHHQIKDKETGEIIPEQHWSKWNICLDGVYMSQIFLVRLAEAIRSGKIIIRSNDGHIVTSEELWNDIYTRLTFVINNMRIEETGLLAHVYSVELQKTNDISWCRGLGWFTMIMVEAAEKMPDPIKKSILQSQYRDLMESVINWQDHESDLWYNVINRKSDLPENRPEISGSSMLTYSLLRGYNNGILDGRHFHYAGLEAFDSIVKNHLTEEGLTDILFGMGPAETPEKYQVPKYTTNEAKGIAPLILASIYAY